MGSQEDIFDRLNVKANRAKKHIDDLSDAIDVFMASEPYKVTTNDDTESGQRTYYINFLKPIPTDLSAIIGDALQNLRSALDHVAHHLVEIGPPGPRAGKVYFPIFPSAGDYEAGKMGKIMGANPAAIQAIDAHQPYARGDGWALWDMHAMNNRDKHRLLIPVWGSLIGHSFSLPERAKVEVALSERFPKGLPRGFLTAPSEPVYLKDGGELGLFRLRRWTITWISESA